jgi:hypothetical protein
LESPLKLILKEEVNHPKLIDVHIYLPHELEIATVQMTFRCSQRTLLSHADIIEESNFDADANHLNLKKLS